MLGFSLPKISFTNRNDLMFVLWIFCALVVLYYMLYFIFKITGYKECWHEKVEKNIKYIRFLAVALIVFVLIYQIIPNLLVNIPALIGVALVIELLSLGCQNFIVNKFNFSKRLKENICFFRLGIFLLLAPFIFLGLFPIMEIPNGIFSESDVLGYYGSLVGGVVTVLGVYWTLKHESEKSKEEKRESSLPIFTFSINLDSENNINDCDDIIPLVIGKNLKDTYENKFAELNKRLKEDKVNIKRLSSELSDVSSLEEAMQKGFEGDEASAEAERIENRKEGELKNLKKEIKSQINKQEFCRIDENIILGIKNIGLQTAILSTIKFIPKGILSSYNESEPIDLNYLSVQKEGTTKLKVNFDWYFENQDGLSTEFREAGSFELEFNDVYRNKYNYKIPIKIKREIVKDDDEIYIVKFKIIIDKPKLPILPV